VTEDGMISCRRDRGDTPGFHYIGETRCGGWGMFLVIVWQASASSPCPACGGDHACRKVEDGRILCRKSRGYVAGCSYLGKTKDGAWGIYRDATDDYRAAAERHTAHVAERIVRGSDEEPRLARRRTRKAPERDWNALVQEFKVAFEDLEYPASTLGVRPDSLERLHAGMVLGGMLYRLNEMQSGCAPHAALTTPERDAAGECVGIGTRDLASGDKGFIKGGHRGLYYADDWADGDGSVVIVEGFSCTAAADTMGLPAIGRPSNKGGVKHLYEMCRDLAADRPVIVIAENDRKPNGTWPGREGAEYVAQELANSLGRPILVALAPDGAKDVRDWLRARSPYLGNYALLEELGALFIDKLMTAAEVIEPAAQVERQDHVRDDQRTDLGSGLDRERIEAVRRAVEAAVRPRAPRPDGTARQQIGRELVYMFRQWRELPNHYEFCNNRLGVYMCKRDNPCRHRTGRVRCGRRRTCKPCSRRYRRLWWEHLECRVRREASGDAAHAELEAAAAAAKEMAEIALRVAAVLAANAEAAFPWAALAAAATETEAKLTSALTLAHEYLEAVEVVGTIRAADLHPEGAGVCKVCERSIYLWEGPASKAEWDRMRKAINRAGGEYAKVAAADERIIVYTTAPLADAVEYAPDFVDDIAADLAAAVDAAGEHPDRQPITTSNGWGRDEVKEQKWIMLGLQNLKPVEVHQIVRGKSKLYSQGRRDVEKRDGEVLMTEVVEWDVPESWDNDLRTALAADLADGPLSQTPRRVEGGTAVCDSGPDSTPCDGSRTVELDLTC
jgi:hypothetical protein